MMMVFVMRLAEEMPSSSGPKDPTASRLFRFSTQSKKVVEAAPGALKMTDSNQHLPLHLACEKGADYDVISCLLEAYPKRQRQRPRHAKTASAVPPEEICLGPQSCLFMCME